MKRLTLLLLTLATLTFTASTSAQTPCRVKRFKTADSGKVRLTSMRAAVPPRANSPISTGGITFHAIASDRKGGVWIGGDVLQEGLLVNINQGRIRKVALLSLSHVRGLVFTTEKTGWLLSQGDVYNTENAGATWERVDIGEQQTTFKTIHFADADNGWIIGDAGTIYHTSDGGQSWNKQTSGTKFDLTQIHFINPLRGWLVGVSPKKGYRTRVFLYTTDGGMTWQSVPSEASAPVEIVGFLDEYRGWAIDVDNNIDETLDGGGTWNVRRPGKQEAWESIHFINHLEGWVAGDGILHTKDGGVSWEYQMPPVNKDAGKFFDKIYFSDNKHGWALGFFRVLQTNDGGKTWNVIPDEWKESIMTKVLQDMSKKSKEIVENN